MIWNIKNGSLHLERPLIMGILNVTPDSFSDGGQFLDPEDALRRAVRLVQDGADILDLGAESTRPGAFPISEQEELDRLLPVLERIASEIQIPISIDTTKSKVAEEALAQGARIINDVSGLKQDPKLGTVVSEYGAGIVLMHRRGTPETMQLMTHYQDLIGDLIKELSESVAIAESCGISADQMVIDPGIGFSKTPEQNLEIIERLNELKSLGRPILIGPSRKSFIGAVTGQSPDKRLMGTVAACLAAFERGARIFRVHDVWAVKEALAVSEAILNAGKQVVG